MAGKKYLRNNAGTLAEEFSVDVSVGSADASKIPALNASGVLAASIVNSKATSAGAGDTGKLPSLDAAGRLDNSFMPVGIGADTQAIVASEILAAGAYVNIWSNAGAFNVRNADNSVSGKEAHGFVLAGVAASATATVYFESTNTAVTGQTPGTVFLGLVGAGTATAPSTAGSVVQRIGIATSATTVNFEPQSPVVLA